MSTTVRENVSEAAQESRTGTSSLGIIALEYENSDSDREVTELDVDKIGNQHTTLTINKQDSKEYRSNIDKILLSEESSTEETDSEDDSSSTSSSSSNDSSTSDDSYNNTNNNSNREKRKNTTNKINHPEEDELDSLPPIEDLKISVSEDLCKLFGEVAWLAQSRLVIIKPNTGMPTLHLDTILFVDKGQRVLGKIFDVFGPVNEAYYCIRFNSLEHIQENDIRVEMPVYYCPNSSYTSLVFLHEVMKLKFSDVEFRPGENSDESPDFSNDEEENAYKKTLEQKNNANASKSNKLQRPKRMRLFRPSQDTSINSWKLNHPWNKNQQPQRHNNNYQENNGPAQFNSAQSVAYTHWPQYSYQRNAATYNSYLMYNEYAAPSFDTPCLPQHTDYSLNNTNIMRRDQNVRTSLDSCPRPLFGSRPSFNPTFPSFPLDCSPVFQSPNTRFWHPNMPYAERPFIPNTSCLPTSPPLPPTSSLSTTDVKIVSQNSS